VGAVARAGVAVGGGGGGVWGGSEWCWAGGSARGGRARVTRPTVKVTLLMTWLIFDATLSLTDLCRLDRSDVSASPAPRPVTQTSSPSAHVDDNLHESPLPIAPPASRSRFSSRRTSGPPGNLDDLGQRRARRRIFAARPHAEGVPTGAPRDLSNRRGLWDSWDDDASSFDKEDGPILRPDPAIARSCRR